MTAADTTPNSPTRTLASPGPVFIAGRQHSGNSVTTKILMQADGCLGFIGDNGYWEHRNLINRVEDPQKRVLRAIEAMRFKENPDLGEAVRQHLPEWIRQHPDADAKAIYLEAMDHCVRITDNRFWLQKATSYIFYADQLMDAIPESKFIYLMRNPYDLVASLKRRFAKRGFKRDEIWATCIGWRKGVRLAGEMQERYPDRFRIVRYEDLVSDPQAKLREIFEFLGYEYRESYANVPRVNTSDNPADWTGVKLGEQASGGLTGFRINYYDKSLTVAEKQAADMLLKPAFVQRYYPDLPHWGEKRSIGSLAGALAYLARHAFRFVTWQLMRYKSVSSKGSYIVERSLHRIRS